jgi:hypothetical protein
MHTAIVFGLINKTSDTLVLTIWKEPVPGVYIDSYLQLLIEAEGYFEYRSSFETHNPQAILFVFDKETETRSLWNISQEVIKAYEDTETLKKALYNLLSDSSTFILEKQQGTYSLRAKHTGELLIPLNQKED